MSRNISTTDIDYRGQIEAINRSQCVIEFDIDGTILTANNNFLEMMGYDLEEIVGKHHSIFAEPGFAETQEYAEFWNFLSQGNYHSAEFKRIAKDGSEIWLQASYNPILNDKDEPYKVVKFAIDITERKTTEAMIASQAVIEFETDGTIITANERFLDLMGYELSEIAGKHHSLFVAEEEKNTHEYLAFWEALRRGEPQIAEFKRFDKNGSEVWLQASYTPFLNRNRDVYKVVKFATDVTHRKVAEEKIDAQHRAIMEMSTPVTAVWDDILLLPVVGFIDSQRAQDVMSAILTKIDETRARVFILDISGVAVVDTAVANHLIKITKATRLMGCDCVISGLSPAIAQTIVDLGIETTGVRTTATLRDALEGAFLSIGVTVRRN